MVLSPLPCLWFAQKNRFSIILQQILILSRRKIKIFF